MRIDKLTTKFQEALGDAQSLALGGDHAYIEPSHVLVAMLRQDDGPKSLLPRAGANVSGRLSSAAPISRQWIFTPASAPYKTSGWLPAPKDWALAG